MEPTIRKYARLDEMKGDAYRYWQSRSVQELVGGYAVIFHSQPRFTKDLDLFIKADVANETATRLNLRRCSALGPA